MVESIGRIPDSVFHWIFASTVLQFGKLTNDALA